MLYSISQPSAREAENLFASLQRNIIADIGRAVHDAMYNRITVDWNILELYELQNSFRAIRFLERITADETNPEYIGPELFRWLGFFSRGIKTGDWEECSYQLLNLPALLFVRVLPHHDKIDQPLDFTLRAEPGSGFCLPQIDDIIAGDFQHNGWIDVRLTSTACIFSSGGITVSIPAGDILSNLDGYRPEDEFYVGRKGQAYLHQTGTVLRQMIAELDEQASAPIQSPENLQVIRFCGLKKDTYPGILQNLTEGYDYIKKCAEEIYKEVLVVIKGITIVSGRRFVGSSDIWYQGIAVFNPDDTWTPITFADHIIHEAAHLLLHASNEMHPVMHNPFELHNDSPIRPDPRPLYGTFHATFVFMRLAQFFEVVVASDQSEEVMFRLNRHIKGFYDGMKILSERAALTEAGRVLLTQMEEYQTRLKTIYPDPDPKKYENKSRDYVI